ncbi:hypothetical protein, unknown function [Leishmania tarentolae]|uniref:Uncharacterized protein n=1 Tax=Leishmania tarentolae TaxID=5689 RepID=A0A640KCU0_LEITA|nr:hypothetical protein, unknown function [Leishmania tarentolae]
MSMGTRTGGSPRTAVARRPACIAVEKQSTAVPRSNDASAVDGILVDPELAARIKEANESLLRILQEAHAALHTSKTVTAALETQGEALTFMEESITENEERWRQGRREMRRTKHWYTALAHWLQCKKGGSQLQVANKSPGAPPAARILLGTASVTDLSTCPRPKGTSMTRSHAIRGAMTTQQQAAYFCNADVLGDCSALTKKGNTVERAAVGEETSTNVKGPGLITTSVSLGNHHQAGADEPRVCRCAGVAMCAQMEPTLDEIRGIVGELHDRATIWNTTLTSDLDRMDELIQRTNKICAKNGGTDVR